MPLLELTEVHARYGPVRALHGISLTLDEGEIVALLGANGAGKTTTLRAISGMVARDGAIVFDGEQLPRRAETTARRGITHVPEGRGILGELTVWENLKMGAYLRRDRKAVARDFDEVASELPWLAQRRDQQAGTLSGGEHGFRGPGFCSSTSRRSASRRSSSSSSSRSSGGSTRSRASRC